MRIGILGGAFNPPTKAHLELVKIGLEEGMDAVWIIPSQTGWRKEIGVCLKERTKMVELMLQGEPALQDRATVALLEQTVADGFVATLDLWDKLEQLYPKVEFTMLVGSDNYLQMPLWRGGLELQRKVKMIVAIRPGSEIGNFSADNIKVIDLGMDIASSNIRDKGVGASGEVANDAIMKYILGHRD